MRDPGQPGDQARVTHPGPCLAELLERTFVTLREDARPGGPLGTAEVLTGREAATLLRVSMKTLLRLAREGLLPGRKVGREWRFVRSELLAWLTSAP